MDELEVFRKSGRKAIKKVKDKLTSANRKSNMDNSFKNFQREGRRFE